MPALVNSSVGSSSGTTLEDGTKVWACFLTKKSMNCWRISLAVGMWSIPVSMEQSKEQATGGNLSSMFRGCLLGPDNCASILQVTDEHPHSIEAWIDIRRTGLRHNVLPSLIMNLNTLRSAVNNFRPRLGRFHL